MNTILAQRREGEEFDVGNVFDQFCSPVSSIAYLEQAQK